MLWELFKDRKNSQRIEQKLQRETNAYDREKAAREAHELFGTYLIKPMHVRRVQELIESIIESMERSETDKILVTSRHYICLDRKKRQLFVDYEKVE